MQSGACVLVDQKPAVSLIRVDVVYFVYQGGEPSFGATAE